MSVRYVYDTPTPICTDLTGATLTTSPVLPSGEGRRLTITVAGCAAIVDLDPPAVARLVDELSRPHPLVDVDELALAEHAGADQ